MLTRKQSISVFEYLRENFLKELAGSPTYLALKQCAMIDLDVLMSLPLADVDNLEYIPIPGPTVFTPAGVAVPLQQCHKNKLKILIKWTHFIVHDANLGVYLTEDEWMQIRSPEFDAYRSDPANVHCK